MSFSNDLLKFTAKTERKMNNLVFKIVIDLGTKIVLRTPVGNPSIWKSGYYPNGYVGGRARANWQYGNGDMPVGVLDIIDKDGNATINKIIGGVSASKAASIHWIANNLPYILPLEEGWSTQAPEGMVRLTVLEFQDVVRQAKNYVN